MKIDVTIVIGVNNRKIDAIKAFRTIVGAGHRLYGLTEAKAYVETNDGYSRRIRLTDAQFGRLVLLSMSSPVPSWGERMYITYNDAKQVEEPDVIDWTN